MGLSLKIQKLPFLGNLRQLKINSASRKEKSTFLYDDIQLVSAASAVNPTDLTQCFLQLPLKCCSLSQLAAGSLTVTQPLLNLSG